MDAAQNAPSPRARPRTLSPADLGLAIGVSESSIKRWADEGQIAIARTRGGHRRIALGEAIRWIRRTGHPVVRPELLGLPDRMRRLERRPTGELARDLTRFLLDGALDEARAALLEAFVAGLALPALARDVLQPALEQVGERWHHGPDGIAVEHAATGACLQALHAIQRLLPEPSGPLALGGAPEHDAHRIPSLLAAMVLQQAGWRAIDLGPHVPVVALRAATARLDPALVWVSLSSDEPRGSLRAWLEVLFAAPELAGRRVVIGGRLAADLRGLDLPPPPQRFVVEESLAALPALAEPSAGAAMPRTNSSSSASRRAE